MSAMQPNDPSAPAAPAALDRALDLVEFLRARCPWDAAQTPESLQPYLLEEAHEVVQAVAAGEENALCGELGDLLLNIAFQVVLAEERGAFGRHDVALALERKMRRRHPHLYGDGSAEPWAVLKARERGATGRGESILDGLASGGDPLLRASSLQQRVAQVGFDWPDALGAWEKLREEMDEVRDEMDGGAAERLSDELGDLLFAAVNLARLAGTHPTTALAAANAKFERRFRALEALGPHRGVHLGSATLEQLDELWNEIKLRERSR